MNHYSPTRAEKPSENARKMTFHKRENASSPPPPLTPWEYLGFGTGVSELLAGEDIIFQLQYLSY